MSYIEESLSKDEQVHELYKLHWFSKVWMFFLIIFSFTIIPIPFAIYEWLRLRSIEQGATNKRVVLKKGIVSRKTEEMKIGSIETIEINQGILGRLFGFGDVEITGRGISDLVFRKIDSPLNVKKSIESINTA